MVKFIASVEATDSDTTDSVMDFTMELLNSVTVAHILHFKATSYSQHMALGSYHTEIGELIDEFVEAFQGKYGLLTDYPTDAMLQVNDDPVKYLEFLKVIVANLRVDATFPSDSEIQNIVDEISALIDSTIYKLKFLK